MKEQKMGTIKEKVWQFFIAIFAFYFAMSFIWGLLVFLVGDVLNIGISGPTADWLYIALMITFEILMYVIAIKYGMERIFKISKTKLTCEDTPKLKKVLKDYWFVFIATTSFCLFVLYDMNIFVKIITSLLQLSLAWVAIIPEFDKYNEKYSKAYLEEEKMDNMFKPFR